MPDIPDEKPARGRGAPARGRGRGRGAPAGTPPVAGALPSERLSSIRNRPATITPAAAAPVASGSTAPKMRFTPTIPVRRNKKEPSALLADKKPEIKREFNSKFERGRGRGIRGGRGQPELVQAVAGPFAQGPASLGNTAARRAMGSVFLGGSSSSSGISGGGSGIIGSGGRVMKPGTSLPGIAGGGGFAEGDDKMDVDGSYGENAPLVSVTDHNEELAIDKLAVQTEEMAIAAAESMNLLNLDTTVADLFTRTTTAEGYDDDDERLVVFQLPGMPEFALSESTIEARREQQKSQESIGDVKPNISELDAAAELVAMAADVKPDLTALTIEDKDKVENNKEEANNEEGAVVEGRIGTLVVLKSGAVKMKIGDILMDVSRGADCQFFRGLMALDGEQGENNHTAFLLGNVDAVALCTPDLENIL
ncbi:hypothetical protein H4R27_006539 [Coemansia aciculifera]|nr:hypothetical protein H4R27_006539 [Coemansia aciculifera]